MEEAKCQYIGSGFLFRSIQIEDSSCMHMHNRRPVSKSVFAIDINPNFNILSVEFKRAFRVYFFSGYELIFHYGLVLILLK